MRILTPALGPLLAVALLTVTPLLQADDKKPEPSAPGKPVKAPKFIGLWESPDKNIHTEIFADGTIHVIPADHSMASGTWKQTDEEGKLQLSLRKDEETMKAVMAIKFEGDDKATFTVENEPQRFTRVKGKLDETKLLGSWKSSETDDEADAVSHYIIIRKKDGKGVCKSLEIFNKKKIYCLDEETFQWRLVGNRLLEHYDIGTPEQSITIYGNIVITPDQISFEMVSDDEYKMTDVRTEEAKLPEAPAGYKKLSPDDYWDVFIEALE